MPIVFIHWWEGKTAEHKAKVAKAVSDAITEVLVSTGMNPANAREQIEIIFNDVPRSNWGYGGVMGKPFYEQRTQPP
jgi:4-oxalocrotonate tautomerase family enzyme